MSEAIRNKKIPVYSKQSIKPSIRKTDENISEKVNTSQPRKTLKELAASLNSKNNGNNVEANVNDKRPNEKISRNYENGEDLTFHFHPSFRGSLNTLDQNNTWSPHLDEIQSKHPVGIKLIPVETTIRRIQNTYPVAVGIKISGMSKNVAHFHGNGGEGFDVIIPAKTSLVKTKINLYEGKKDVKYNVDMLNEYQYLSDPKNIENGIIATTSDMAIVDPNSFIATVANKLFTDRDLTEDDVDLADVDGYGKQSMLIRHQALTKIKNHIRDINATSPFNQIENTKITCHRIDGKNFNNKEGIIANTEIAKGFSDEIMGDNGSIDLSIESKYLVYNPSLE